MGTKPEEPIPDATIGELVATDPTFRRLAGLPDTPTDAGAVHKHWKASRADIEARGTETVERKAEENREQARSFGQVNPSGEDLTQSAVRREIEARGRSIQDMVDERFEGAEDLPAPSFDQFFPIDTTP